MSEWDAIQMTVTNVNRAVVVAMDRRAKKQAELLEAVRDRKKMELLVKRAAERRQRVQRRLDQRILDDLTSQRWGRDSS